MAKLEMSLEELEMMMEKVSTESPLFDRLKKAHDTESMVALGYEKVAECYEYGHRFELACANEMVYKNYYDFGSVPFLVHFNRLDEESQMQVSDYFKVWVSYVKRNGKWCAEV